jgi:hypothetical protein
MSLAEVETKCPIEVFLDDERIQPLNPQKLAEKVCLLFDSFDAL